MSVLILLKWWISWARLLSRPVVKTLPANAGDTRDTGSIPGPGRSPGGGSINHSSIIAWKIPWREKHGRLQSSGLWRAGHNWVTEQKLFYNEYALWLMLSLRNIDIQKFLISHRCLVKLRWPFPKPWQLVAEIGYTLWEEHTVSFAALIRQPGNPTPKRTLQRQLSWERVSAQHATRQT